MVHGSLYETELLLTRVENEHDIIGEDLDRVRFLIHSKNHTLDKARERIKQSFELIQSSIESLVYVLERYEDQREGIAKIVRCMIGAHTNSELFRTFRGYDDNR